MMDCRQAARLISQKEDGTIRLRDRLALWVHTAMCAYCKAFDVHTTRLGEWMRDLTTTDGVELTVDERERILRRLEDEIDDSDQSTPVL